MGCTQSNDLPTGFARGRRGPLAPESELQLRYEASVRESSGRSDWLPQASHRRSTASLNPLADHFANLTTSVPSDAFVANDTTVAPQGDRMQSSTAERQVAEATSAADAPQATTA